MRHILLLLFVALLAVGCGGDPVPDADNETKEKPKNAAVKPTPENPVVDNSKPKEVPAETKELVGFAKIENDFKMAFSDAERNDRLNVLNEFARKMIDYSGTTDDETERKQAIQWAAKRAAGTEAGNEAMESLIETDIDSDFLGPIIAGLAKSVPSEKTENIFRNVIAKTTNPKTKAQIQIALYTFLDGVLQGKSAVKDPKVAERVGKEVVEFVSRDRGPKHRDELKAILQDVIDNSADIQLGRTTAGQIATDKLFVLEKLSVGAEAMEIEGEDLDGKSFKLSDYRGKIVLLDFWGDW